MTLYLEKPFQDRGEIVDIPSFMRFPQLLIYYPQSHLRDLLKKSKPRSGDLIWAAGNFSQDDTVEEEAVEGGYFGESVELVFIRNFSQLYFQNPAAKNAEAGANIIPGFYCSPYDQASLARGVAQGFEKKFAHVYLFYNKEIGFCIMRLKISGAKFHQSFQANYIMRYNRYSSSQLRCYKITTEEFVTSQARKPTLGYRLLSERAADYDEFDKIQGSEVVSFLCPGGRIEGSKPYSVLPAPEVVVQTQYVKREEEESRLIEAQPSKSQADEDGVVIDQEAQPKQIAKQESRSQPTKASRMKKNSFVSTMDPDELNQEIPF